MVQYTNTILFSNVLVQYSSGWSSRTKHIDQLFEIQTLKSLVFNVSSIQMVDIQIPTVVYYSDPLCCAAHFQKQVLHQFMKKSLYKEENKLSTA